MQLNFGKQQMSNTSISSAITPFYVQGMVNGKYCPNNLVFCMIFEVREFLPYFFQPIWEHIRKVSVGKKAFKNYNPLQVPKFLETQTHLSSISE